MPITMKDLGKLSSVQKVAIILLTLSDDNATKIFSMLGEDEIADISRTMSNLGAVQSDVIESVMDDLMTNLLGGGDYIGNFKSTEKLLGKIMDKDKAANLLEDIRGPQGKNTWEKLANVNEELLALYLRNEHPQTAALVLTKLSPEHSSKVLSNLSDSFAFDIISRMLTMGTVKKEIMDKVEKILRAEFISSVGKAQTYDSHEMLAEIFNNLDRNSETKFMAMLESDLPDAALKIKDKMFTFEDLLKIDAKGIQRLLKDVEKSKLTLALKGANKPLSELLLSSMSQRAAKIIEEDLMALGSVRVKDVDTARSEIVVIAKQLIEIGEVDIAMDKEEDEFVS